jgi:hypothetical protein
MPARRSAQIALPTAWMMTALSSIVPRPAAGLGPLSQSGRIAIAASINHAERMRASIGKQFAQTLIAGYAETVRSRRDG